MRDIVRPSPSTDRAHDASETAQGRSRRWTALMIITLAQLMVALDATIIINIGKPAKYHGDEPPTAGGSPSAIDR